MPLKYNLIFILFFCGFLMPESESINSMSGKLPPGVSYREVSLQLRIMHIYDINLDHQTVRLSGYFRQSWNDSRMMGNQYDSVTPGGRRFFLMNKADALWYPDTFISNSIDHQDRESFSGDPHAAYHYFRVYTDGEVLYSQMIDIMIKVKMNLKYYPFNVLNISLDVESYGYPDHTLRYVPGSYTDDNGLIIKIQNVPGYEINESLAKSFLTSAEYSTGNFSKIEMLFNLIPNDSSLFILSIPNLLLIIISSFVFWMDVKKKLSERLSLGITAMLADFALSFSLPVPDTPDFLYVREYINISYIFIGFSIVFTFMEYIIVAFFYNVKNNDNKSNTKNQSDRKATNFCYNSLISSSIQNLKNNFSKLLSMNQLMRYSLIDYIDNALPEEPVMPIKAALGVFYLLCWVSFMVGHIIPGKLIMEKAREGINYQDQAVKYFPTIMSIGLSISFILSGFAFFVQNRSRNKWIKKMKKRDDKINNYSSIINTNANITSGENITCKLDNETLEEIKKKDKIEINDIDLEKYDDKIKSINDDIERNFDLIDEVLNLDSDINQNLTTRIRKNKKKNIIVDVV